MKTRDIDENKTKKKKTRYQEGSKTKPKNGRNSDISYATNTTGYSTGMPQGSGYVRNWRYTVYRSPPACYHIVYGIFLPDQRPRPNEDLQRAANPSDQQVGDICLEEGIILHLLGVWPPTNSGANNIHLMDTFTTRVERVRTRGWGMLNQIRPSWYQGGQDWCWMGIFWLAGEFCHKDGEWNRCWWCTPQIHHLHDQA